jgi:hypothetical protein
MRNSLAGVDGVAEVVGCGQGNIHKPNAASSFVAF